MKKLILSAIIASFLLVGCHSPKVEERIVYINSKCPTFNEKFKIEVLELDNNYAKISWEDVDKIEHFLKKKKTFNKEVQKLNKGSK